METTHIGFTCSKPRGGQIVYEIYTGNHELEKRVHGIVGKTEIPKKYQDTLTRNAVEWRERPAFLGQITYSLKESHATSTHYYPKGRIGAADLAKGLGTVLEALCVTHLQKRGIKTISTSDQHTLARRKQLSRIGLEPEKTYPIREWLDALKNDPRQREK